MHRVTFKDETVSDQRNKSHRTSFVPFQVGKLHPFSLVCKHLLVYGKMEGARTHVNLEFGLMNLHEARRGQLDMI